MPYVINILPIVLPSEACTQVSTVDPVLQSFAEKSIQEINKIISVSSTRMMLYQSLVEPTLLSSSLEEVAIYDDPKNPIAIIQAIRHRASHLNAWHMRVGMLETNPILLKNVYLRTAKLAKSACAGNCAEFSFLTAEWLEQNNFPGNIFLATYNSTHQFVIVRMSKAPELAYQLGDCIIDSWGGWYDTVANAIHYPINFIINTVDIMGKQTSTATAQLPPADTFLSQLHYGLWWNHPDFVTKPETKPDYLAYYSRFH